MRAFAVLIIACLAPSACEPSPEGPAPPPSPSTLLLKNSDAVFHNVRASGAYEFNVGLGGGSPSTLGPLRRKGVVAVACDIHAWMSGYLYVTDSPHAAVTGPDGRFRIGGVPAGLQRVVIWHEALEGAEAAVEVRPGETSEFEKEIVLKSR